MIQYTVTTSQRALDDLERNAKWWAVNKDEHEASEWSRKLRDEIKGLSLLPASRPLAIENDDMPFEMRCFHFQGYRALFTIVEDVVVVLAVHSCEQHPISMQDIKFP